jgi:chromosome segregation protein
MALERRTAVELEHRRVLAVVEALDHQSRELEQRMADDAGRVAALMALLPALEAEEMAGRERAVAQQAARRRLDERAQALRASRANLDVRASTIDERRRLLQRRSAEVESRLSAHRADRATAGERRVAMAQQGAALERLSAVVAERVAVLEAKVAELRALRQRQIGLVHDVAQRLDGQRRERTEAERDLTAVRERARRAELDEAEIRLRLETATETLRRDFECDPETARAAECPELAPGTSPEQRVRELERDLRLMGPINPLAVEEFAALQERHAFLEGQLEDVKAGRRDLAKVIRAIDAEIIDVFSAAYADVADNFSNLFATLFPGGTGRLRLSDPDNLLETGIEVEARPSGKNVKRLSLLSGGERSLVAMAFLFAVFRSRPSPFYLMDEVEAALDDVNLHRFLDLIREFRAEAQLVIVSHQKRTMEAADCLYGVTMQTAGASRVVSERVTAIAG